MPLFIFPAENKTATIYMRAWTLCMRPDNKDPARTQRIVQRMHFPSLSGGGVICLSYLACDPITALHAH